MYSWTALLTSIFFVELPWNFFGSVMLFFTWYWTAGFPGSRAPYSFLIMDVVFPLYYTSFAMGITAVSGTAEIAALLTSSLFSFVVML